MGASMDSGRVHNVFLFLPVEQKPLLMMMCAVKIGVEPGRICGRSLASSSCSCCLLCVFLRSACKTVTSVYRHLPDISLHRDLDYTIKLMK